MTEKRNRSKKKILFLTSSDFRELGWLLGILLVSTVALQLVFFAFGMQVPVFYIWMGVGLILYPFWSKFRKKFIV